MAETHSLLELAGILSKEKADELERNIRAGRERMNTRTKRIVREMNAS